MKRAMLAVLMILLLLVGGAVYADDVVLEFQQWWEPELPEGAFRALLDEFEAANPGIKVETISGPYLTTKDQIIASAATGTMADVVGLDGGWVNVLFKQGAIANLTEVMAAAEFDDSELAAQIQLAGGTYMIPIANFIYPVFVNLDMLAAAGIDPPTTRAEFAAAAEALTDPDNNVYGWAQPLSLEQPNGIQNDTMSWVWASGGSMLDEMGMPNLVGNELLADTMAYIKSLHDAGVVVPGSFSMKENEKVEEIRERARGHDHQHAGALHADPRAQPRPELRHHGAAGRRGLRWSARLALRILGHRHRREHRAHDGSLEADRVP